MKEFTTLNFTESEEKKENNFSRSRNFVYVSIFMRVSNGWKILFV